MGVLLVLSRQTSVRLAEVGFLLIVIAGVWLVAAETLNPERWRRFRTAAAGLLLAVAGVLLIVTTHWGQLG
jgi:hypothetical protein